MEVYSCNGLNVVKVNLLHLHRLTFNSGTSDKWPRTCVITSQLSFVTNLFQLYSSHKPIMNYEHIKPISSQASPIFAKVWEWFFWCPGVILIHTLIDETKRNFHSNWFKALCWLLKPLREKRKNKMATIVGEENPGNIFLLSHVKIKNWASSQCHGIAY